MKRVFALLFVLCVSCTGLSLHNTALNAAIEQDRDATVMLVETAPEDGKDYAYCSGVWISETEILTAYHCVRDKSKDEGKELGDKLKIAYRQDYISIDKAEDMVKEGHGAVVVKVDPEDDLALLKVNKVEYEHGVAVISQEEIRDGDAVLVVGHPMGMGYVWVPGTVAKTVSMSNPHDHVVKMLHITSSAWFGNSGGAAFDMEGNVVGICSFLLRGPQMTMFVHRDVIVKFLKAE